MTADEHLSQHQFVDVYHGTDEPESVLRGPVINSELYVSTVPHSRYMANTGASRMHLRVPQDKLSSDPLEHTERRHGLGMAANEHHYVLHADNVSEYYQGHKQYPSTTNQD